MEEKKEHTVIFQPSGRRGLVEAGITIAEAARRLGEDIEMLCGGQRVCGKCRVRVEEGNHTHLGLESGGKHAGPWSESEERFITPDERADGYRLGCAATVEGDLVVFVPEKSRAGKQVVSKSIRDLPLEWDPAVKLYSVSVPPPTIKDPTGDWERVRDALGREHALDPQTLGVDFFALRALPDVLRQTETKWSLTAAVRMDSEIICFLPGHVDDCYGVAIDLGTTTCAAYLCNLRTMAVEASASMMNPQCKYGEDVMARISYHMSNPDGLARMSGDIIAGLNDLIFRCCEQTGQAGDGPVVRPSDVLDLTLVGNTAMHHILLGLNPANLGQSPFPPVVHSGLDVKARDLGLRINPSAYAYVLPNEAAFVGADNVGVLIAEEPYRGDEMQLIIDIGTNGELVLGNRDRLVSASCATGPALEGAQITWGMRAAPGAIERIKIDPDTHEVDYKVIGREAWRSFSRPEEMGAKGICGSGILDVLAEMYRAGIVLKSGRFNPQQTSERFRPTPGEEHGKEFVIAWAEETSEGMNKDIVITQKDIRQIQLAKGALYAGCRLIMRRMGLETVDRVKIAGAFGTHVDRKNALIMGLFPYCELEKIECVGNAAGDGARAALLNRGKREEAAWCARHVDYVELTLDNDFQTEFVAALEIPHRNDPFPEIE